MCTIYHWSHEDKEYTIEFVPSSFRSADRGLEHYRIGQMLQCCNKKAGPKDWAIVESYIRGTNEFEEEGSTDIENWI